jgi:hypothetical protein
MSELEQDGAAPEPAPATAAPPVDAAPASHADAPEPSEPELEQPPVWEDPNESDSEAYPEHSDDAWAFLQDAAQELNDPPEATPAARRPAREGAIERAWVVGLFNPNIGDLLGLAERALRALPGSKPAARLLELVSRARAAKATEPRLLEELLRAQASGRMTDDFGLLAVLLARRLALQSLRAEARAVETALRVRVLRELRALVRRVSRARGDEGLRELARWSAQLGARASERGHDIDELAPLLRQRFERAESTSTRPALEAESSAPKRTRRFRLPGRVEIVIYEE